MTACISEPAGLRWEQERWCAEIVQSSSTSAAWLQKSVQGRQAYDVTLCQEEERSKTHGCTHIYTSEGFSVGTEQCHISNQV